MSGVSLTWLPLLQLSDFGLAFDAQGQLLDFFGRGSVAYMAPEVHDRARLVDNKVRFLRPLSSMLHLVMTFVKICGFTSFQRTSRARKVSIYFVLSSL